MDVKSVKFLSSIFSVLGFFMCFDKRQKPKELCFVILRFHTYFISERTFLKSKVYIINCPSPWPSWMRLRDLHNRSENLRRTLSGPVHTNPYSNENGAVLPRIRLSSPLQRRKRSPKPEPFENALHSGAIWKRCFLKTLFSSVEGENDAIWKRWRHQNRHDRAPDREIGIVVWRAKTIWKR